MKIITYSSIKILIFMLMLFTIGNVNAQNTQVTVSGIRSPKGQIILSVFKDEKTFEEEKPFKKIVFDKKTISDGTLILNFEIEQGTYGITILDDENLNGKLEKSMIGMPKEGFGFSNFYLEKLKKPSFSEFKTDVKYGGNNIGIRVKYM